MWRKLVPSSVFFDAASRKLTPPLKSFLCSSSSPFNKEEPVPELYSFLRPTLFSITNPTPPTPPTPSSTSRQTISPTTAASVESFLISSVQASNTDEAWKCFKSLTSAYMFPSPDLTFALVCHLCSLKDLHNLKRAFASIVLLLEKNPKALSFPTLETIFAAIESANTPAPAFALVRAMFKHRFFPPFSVWGGVLINLSKRQGGFLGEFLEVFEENCRIAKEEGIQFMVPDLEAFKVAMEVCCCELGSVSGAKRIVETMTTLGVVPDVESFGAMAYLFAWKGLDGRIVELEELVHSLRLTDTTVIHENLIGGYVKSGDLKLVTTVILRALQEVRVKEVENWKGFREETYTEVVNCFVGNRRTKELATLIVECQKIESSQLSIRIEGSVGFGIIKACVRLGMLDKAHSIIDEMNAQGASVGTGVYLPILKAYCNERRMAEATQLVAQIGAAELQLDSGSYDALIDASMSVQDFQSALSLFRGMQDASFPGLKMSYLTIMTGLMENQRPELMAGFLETVVGDPRIEVTSHDWNSIIHAFCKNGRLEDARRTYRRMIFLQFEPNKQTYLSLINGYLSAEKYFSVLILWTDIKKKKAVEFDNTLVDAFLYALVKGGFFDAAMEVVEKAHELKIFIDKWRYKQAFMETHKKLKVAKMRRRNLKKVEALVAFKNWAGLSA